MSLKQKAINGILWTFIHQFSVQGVTFFVSLLLARLILPSEFGLIAMISVFISIGNTLINSGMSQSLLRTNLPTDEEYSTIFYFNVLISILVYIILFTLSNSIALFFNQEKLKLIIRVYCLSFIINAFSSIQIIRLTLNFDFKSQARISIPSVILSSLLGLFLAYKGFGVWSLIWSTLTQSFIQNLQYWLISKWRPVVVFNKKIIIKHWKFGYKLLISGIIDNIFTNAYSISIGKFFTPAQVGFYQRADSLKHFPVSSISSIIDKVTFPLLSSIQEDDVRLKIIYRKIMQVVIFLISPLLIFSAVLANPIIKILFTEKWLPSVPYFQILCFSGILYPIHVYNLSILNIKGRSDLFLKLEVVKTIAIIIFISVSLYWGIYGLLFSTIFSSIFSLFVNCHYTKRLINYSFIQQISDLYPSLILSILTGIILIYINNYFNNYGLNEIGRIIVSFLIGFIIYLGFSFLFKHNALRELIKLIDK
jgi:teichuronic acid exporter